MSRVKIGKVYIDKGFTQMIEPYYKCAGTKNVFRCNVFFLDKVNKRITGFTTVEQPLTCIGYTETTMDIFKMLYGDKYAGL